MDAPTFRQQFKEFIDPTIYTDSEVNFWLTVGQSMLDPDRWQTLQDNGLALFIAHHLVVSHREQDTAGAGGTPGIVAGPQTAKSVDKVSVSMDPGAVMYDSAGFWNMSTYGIQFFQLARMIGAGGIQM